MKKAIGETQTKVSLLVFLILTFWLSTTISAAIITITTTLDNVPGSLRDAITIANAATEDTKIILPAGTYVLIGDPREDENKSGDLDIYPKKKVSIVGDGVGETKIDGNRMERVLHIHHGIVDISGVCIRNGVSPDGFEGGTSIFDGDGEDGGGIYNSGSLTIRDSSIVYNETGYGAYSMDNWEQGGRGGGIYNDNYLTLINCVVGMNTSRGKSVGGGSKEGGGGGIYNGKSATLSFCTVYNNEAQTAAEGGGILNVGSLVLNDCSIRDNKSGGAFGDMIYFYPISGGAGGGICNFGTITLTRCLINSNETGKGNEYSTFGNAGPGGGIANYGKSTLINCTISGNKTGNGNMSISGSGGGIGNYHEMHLNHCTITNNSIGRNIDIVNNKCQGGGIFNSGTQLNVKNTIVAGNHILVYQEGPDCYGEIDSQGYNLIQDISGCTISGDTVGNIIGKDPKIGKLEDNGGSSKTHALLDNSPAIDAGHSPDITDDQRSYLRPVDVKGVNNIGNGADIGAYEYEDSSPTFLTLNRHQFFFGADRHGIVTGPQRLNISFTDDRDISWVIDRREDLTFVVNTYPYYGKGNYSVGITVLPNVWRYPGTYSETLTVVSSEAFDSPQTIEVNLIVYEVGSTQPPFGIMDTPTDNSVVSGSIAITGWALDDIDIEDVKIYREPVSGEGSEPVYIGTALFVEGARPDILETFPQSPGANRAGWGYLLLTNMLPQRGNGKFVLQAIATDKEGNSMTLGRRTIICDNANAVKPFGTIDTPNVGDYITGSNYVNFGWALTPLPKTIPFDGSTITVWVDGQQMGHPVYNNYRADIAKLFPQYNNSDGALGYYYLDTTKFRRGLHTMAWSVKDDAGVGDGIGSRYFTIYHGSIRTSSTTTVAPEILQYPTQIPLEYQSPLSLGTGFDSETPYKDIYPDENGTVTVCVRPLEPLEIRFPDLALVCLISPLPVGASLTEEEGENQKVFRWLPGLAYAGPHQLSFLVQDSGGNYFKKNVVVDIRSK